MDSKHGEQVKALREAFNKVDVNGNGYLDSAEVTNVLKNLGVEVSSDELNAFYKEADTDHDGQISFEELAVWFNSHKTGQKGGVHNKILSAFKQYKNDAKKTQQSLADAKKNIDAYHAGVSVGILQEGKTKIEVGSQFGEEGSAKFDEISAGLDITSTASVILQFGSSNPAAAKEGVLTFFQSALEFAKGMGLEPPGFSLDSIKLSASTDDKHVRIGIQVDHEIINSVSGQVDFFANAFLEGNLTGSLGLGVSLNTCIGDLVSETDSTLAQQILKGFSVNFDLRLPQFVAAFARNILKQNKGSLPPQVQAVLKKVGPLLLLRKANVQFDLETGDAWAEALEGVIPPVKFGDFLPQLQAMGVADMASMMFPPFAEFLPIAQEHLNSDLKIFIRGPQALAHVHLKSEGLGKLWESLSPQ